MDIGNFCSICDVTFTSETHAESHYTGKKHRKKEDFGKPRQPGGSRRNCVSQKPSGETAPSDWSPSSKPRNGFARDDFDGSRSLWQQDDGDTYPSTPNESGHLYYCNPCMKNFSGPSPMKQHMASPSHDKQVKKMKAKSAKDSCRDNNNNNNRNGHPIPYWKDLSTTGQARAHECERNSESSEGSGKLVTPPRDDAVTSGSAASLPNMSRCSGANDLRSRLIGMCTAKLNEELYRIIPSIAESVVDAVLGSLLREEKLTQADETSSQNQDGSRTPRLNVEEPTLSPEADESGENGQQLHQCSTGTWVEKHTQPADLDDDRNTGGNSAACSSTTSGESEPTNDVSENSKLANPETGARVAGTREDRDGDVSSGCELTEQQRCFQGTNGIGVQMNTNHSETIDDDYVEIYGVQMKKGRDFVPSAQEPIAADPASEESMFDLKSATRGELEPCGISPRVVQQSMTENGHCNLTSQDLIDFDELKNAQNEQSVAMLDHQQRHGDPAQMVNFIDHKHTGSTDSGIDCKSPKGSEGDLQDTNFQKHGCGSPVMDVHVSQSQRYGHYYVADDNGRRPFTGDPPLAEECGWRYH